MNSVINKFVKKMDVKKFILGLVLLSSVNLFGQENEIYFLLESDNSEYVFFINGDKEYHKELCEAENFFITSTEKYTAFLKDKKELLKGETNLTGLTFKVKKKKILKSHEIENLHWVNYGWIKDNSRVQSKELIELNAFKNLYIVLRKGEDYVSYDVVREFSSH